jgi:hypothetical protein
MIFRRVVRWSVGTQNHQLITQRNSLTALYLWVLCIFAVAPAVLFWNNHWVLKGFALGFAMLYLWLYRSLVKFRIPSFLILRNV